METESNRPSQQAALESAIDQANLGGCVRVKRHELCHLMRATDSEGRPLFVIYYDRATGLHLLFMGRHVVVQ